MRAKGLALTCRLTTIISFVGALLTRFFLGFVEAAFFPGALVGVTQYSNLAEH